MHWRLYPKISEDFIRQFPEYPTAVLQLLYNRGLKTQKQIDEFFNPDFDGDLHDPFLLKGMKEGVGLIEAAINKQKKIVVWGDYDVDGVCGSLILKSTLDILGAKSVTIYIPDRVKEGYGLNSEAIKNLSQGGTELIITVDCGISNFKEVKLAKKLGLEIIITDHHQVLKKLPEAKIIINPHQENDQYPFKYLAGAGVAYKLALALLNKFRISKLIPVHPGWEKWLLDLVALATVADKMVLVGENRTLVKYGLIVLGKTQRVGLKELINQSGLTSQEIDSGDIAFILAPRLNAAGRMDHADMACELLATESSEEAKWLSQRLCQLNQERQNIVNKIIKEIEGTLGNDKIIFTGGENWPGGILGIIAGKLCGKYYRPAIIFNQETDKSEIKGTSRSIVQFNMVEVLSQCAPLLLRFGGHPQAAGFSLQKENLNKFKECLFKQAKKLSDEDLIPALNVDLEIKPAELDWSIYEQIQPFAPFGDANPEPVWLMRNLKIKNIKIVGNGGQHLKMELQAFDPPVGGKSFKAIGFNFSSEMEKLKIGDSIDVVFEMIDNKWNGFRNLEMKIIDLKSAT